MDDRTLALILRLTLDGQSQQNLKTGVTELKKNLGEMRKAADDARKALNDALVKGDQDGAKRLKRSLEDIEAKIGDVEEEARDTFGKNFIDAAKKASNEMRELSERAGEVSRAVGLAGSAVVVGMAAAAQNYASQTGQAEYASRRWLATTDQLQQANLRLGKASAQALQPWYDRLSSIVDKAADFAERNPSSVGGLAAAGIAAVGVGGLGEAAVQGIKLVADVKLLGAAALQKQAADNMLKAAGVQLAASKSKLPGGLPLVSSGLAVAGLAGATAAVGGLGYAAYEGLRGTEYGKNLPGGVNGMLQQAGTSLVQIGGLGAVGLAKLSDAIGITGNAAQVTAQMLPKLIDGVKGLGSETEKTAARLTESSQEFQLYKQYLQDEQEAKHRASAQIAEAEQRSAEERTTSDQRTEEERTRITEQYGARRVELEQNYEAQRTETLASQAKARARAQQDLDRSLSDMAAAHAEQQANLASSLRDQIAQIDENAEKAQIEAKKEHQKRLLQLEQDHDGRVRDLVAGRDALGLANENERYSQAKAGENASFRDQLQDIRQNAAEQREAAREAQAKALADLERSYQQQRQKAIEQFNFQQQRQAEDDAETLAKLDARHAEELAKLDAQNAAELKKLDEKHAAELRQIDENTRQTLAKLRAAAAEEQRQRAAALQTQMRELLGIQKQGEQSMLAAAQAYVDGLKQKAAQLDGVASGSTAGNTPVSGGASNAPTSGSPTGQLIPGRARGGPINEGLVYAHDYEYMISQPYRTALESELGAPLSQERLLAGVRQARGGSGAGGSVYNLQVTLPLVTGSITAQERRAIIGDARGEIMTWLDKTMDGMS